MEFSRRGPLQENLNLPSLRGVRTGWGEGRALGDILRQEAVAGTPLQPEAHASWGPSVPPVKGSRPRGEAEASGRPLAGTAAHAQTLRRGC